MAALKEHVTLAEALEIEAVKCAAGDARHDYQEWYPKYKELQRKRRSQGEPSGPADAVDPATAAEELALTMKAIEETEEMLAEHRLAVVERRASPYSDADVDGMHSVLESMRANLYALELAAKDADADGEVSGG